jgi:hypothetical protein
LSHAPVLFAMVNLETGSHFIPRPAWTAVLLFVLPHIAEMTGVSHWTQLLTEMMSCEVFGLTWPWTMIFLVSASQVTRIISVSHQYLATITIFTGSRVVVAVLPTFTEC